MRILVGGGGRGGVSWVEPRGQIVITQGTVGGTEPTGSKGPQVP